MFIFNGSSLGAEKRPYKLGAIYSVTGPAALMGDPQKKTTEMLVDQINAAGGIDGHPLEVILYDDESDDTKARLLATKLMMTEKVLGLLGPSGTGDSMAVVDIAQEYKCPMIAMAASWMVTTDPKTNKARYWVFKIPLDDKGCVARLYDFMKSKGINKIASLTNTTAYGASGREALSEMAPSHGITIVADEKFGPKDSDMTTQLTRIRGSQAQAIVGWTIGPTQTIIMRNWRDLGMTKITFFQSFGFGDRKTIVLAAGAAEGVYTLVTPGSVATLLPDTHVQKKVTMDYTLAYEKKYNDRVSLFGGSASDALRLYVDALKKVGEKHTSVEALRKAIRDHLENTKGFVGQHGVFNFSPEHHMGLTKDAYVMVVVKSGDFALVQ